MKKCFLLLLIGCIMFFLIRFGSFHVLADAPAVIGSNSYTGTYTTSTGTGSINATYHNYQYDPTLITDLEDISPTQPPTQRSYSMQSDVIVCFEFSFPNMTIGNYYTGHINLPVYINRYLNSNVSTWFSNGSVPGSHQFSGCSLEVVASNDDSIRFSMFQSGNISYLTVYFNNYMYLGGIECFCHFIDNYVLTTYDLDSILANAAGLHTCNFTRGSQTLSGYFEAGVSLQQCIINGINNSSDIDTLLTRLNSANSYLSSIGSSVSSLVSYFNGSNIQAAIAAAINSSTDIDSIITLLTSLVSYGYDIDQCTYDIKQTLTSYIDASLSDILSVVQSQTGQYSSDLQGLASDLGSIAQNFIDLLAVLGYDDYYNEGTSVTQILYDMYSLFNTIYTYIQTGNVNTLGARVNQMYQYIYNLYIWLGYNSASGTLKNDMLSVISALSDLLSYDGQDDQTYNLVYLLLCDEQELLENVDSHMTNLNMIYNRLLVQHNDLNMLLRMFTGAISIDTGSQVQRLFHDNMVNIITEALNSIEVTIDIDDDHSITYNITNEDVTNVYYDQEIIHNFELNIHDLFSGYMGVIDFTVLHAPDPQIVAARTSVTNLLEEMYNRIGSLQFLVIVTLLIGLISALLGPINRFVVSRFRN